MRIGGKQETSTREEGKWEDKILIGYVPIPPSLKASKKILKVLGLRGQHIMKLIMPLLNKVTERNMLRLYICPKRGLLLMYELDGGIHLFRVR